MPLRTYGRVPDPVTGLTTKWVQVNPDPQGNPGSVYLTALIQTLKLNLGESPFYGDWGIPAHESVVTQIYPDYYVTLTQQRYLSQFMSLVVVKQPVTTPTYDVAVQFKSGARVSVDSNGNKYVPV